MILVKSIGLQNNTHRANVKEESLEIAIWPSKGFPQQILIEALATTNFFGAIPSQRRKQSD
jgi:hypothetical protein